MSREWEIWDTERAEYYEGRYGSPSNPEEKHAGRMNLAASLVEGESILDVGCGIGHFYSYVKDYDYLGVDNSVAMIDKARHHHPEANFQHGDVYNLEAPMKDTVISQSLLIHLPDFEAPVRQMWSKANQALIFSIPVGRDIVNKWLQIGDKYLLSQCKPLKYVEQVCRRLPGFNEFSYVVEPGTRINNTYFKVIRCST